MSESTRIEDISNDLEQFPISLVCNDVKEFEELQKTFHKVKQKKSFFLVLL